MDWLSALILGIVQGATEYLPVSSSGHLAIFRDLLGVDLPADQALQFDIIVHFATVLSTIVILLPLFKRLVKAFFSMRNTEDSRYVWKILLSCIPVGIVGLFFKDTVEEVFGEGLTVVGICLNATACLLAFAYFSSFNRSTGKVKPDTAGHKISWVDAFVIGCGQALAVLPGLSRSGTTIATGILLGDRRSEVAQFSFIMVILPIIGETLLDLAKMISPAAGATAGAGVGAIAMIIGFVAAFLVGCAACKWMIALVKKGKLIWFAVYCLIIGIVCILAA